MPSREPGVARKSVAYLRRQRCSTGSQDAVAELAAAATWVAGQSRICRSDTVSARPSASILPFFRKPRHCSCLAALSPNDAVNAAGGSVGRGVPRRLKVAAIACALELERSLSAAT